MDAAMADERRVRLCGLPFLMNEAWLRHVLHSEDIKRPWKVVLLRKGEHKLEPVAERFYLLWDTSRSHPSCKAAGQLPATRLVEKADCRVGQAWRTEMEAWIAMFSVIKLEEPNQFHYIGWVLPYIQKFVCLFLDVGWCNSSTWLQQRYFQWRAQGKIVPMIFHFLHLRTGQSTEAPHQSRPTTSEPVAPEGSRRLVCKVSKYSFNLCSLCPC